MGFLRKWRRLFILFHFVVLLSSQFIIFSAVAKLEMWKTLAHFPAVKAAMAGAVILAFLVLLVRRKRRAGAAHNPASDVLHCASGVEDGCCNGLAIRDAAAGRAS